MGSRCLQYILIVSKSDPVPRLRDASSLAQALSLSRFYASAQVCEI